MATQGFFITDTDDGISDGLIKDKDKNLIGRAWQQEAPVGHFINGKLEGYWIITNEEYKILKQNVKDTSNIGSKQD